MAGVLLVALGIGTLAPVIMGAASGGGGFLFIPLAVPPIGAGFLVLQRARWARVGGVSVALAYAAAVAYVATAAWRGLTPAPGQTRSAIDPVSILVTLAFLAAALLLLLGDRSRGERAR